MSFLIKKCDANDDIYPKVLKHLNGMPQVLYYQGNISILNENKCVAIVGSRKCSDDALSFSRKAGEEAARQGLVVVNGLAIGCDTAALIGALDAGGKCAIILPGGLEHITPKSNIEIAERILKTGGCLISEYESYVTPKKYTYVQRDRLQSAVSQGVFVVETKIDGGTMYTVEAATKQKRKIAAYALGVLNNGSGNKLIIDRGNTSVTNIDELKKYYISLGKEMEWEQLSLF